MTVLCRGEDKIEESGKHRVRWTCVCDCGKIVTILSDNLRCERTMSCGCFRSEKSALRNKTHGKSTTKLYGVWCGIKARCFNKNSTAYKDYGGRGIKMCEEWSNHYDLFEKWAIDNGYKEGLSIDRIDNNGDYSPENCRWVTDAAQANNRRSNRIYTINGVTHNLTEWANILGINPKTLFNRVYTGVDFEKAITY